MRSQASHWLENRAKHYIVRMIKPNFGDLSRLACSTGLSKIRTGCRLSGPFWIEEYTASLCVPELAALHVHDFVVF